MAGKYIKHGRGQNNFSMPKTGHVGYTLPGYNYLGPGNNIFLEEDIVNSADFIAYVHDIEYTLSNNTKEIRDSDYKALINFLSDYKKTGILGDLIGFIGIGIKYGVESATGVLYPSMSNTIRELTWGQFLYAKREKHFAEVYKQIKNRFVNINAFKKSEEGKIELAKFQQGGEFYKKLHSDFFATNKAPQPIPEPVAGPSNENKRQREPSDSDTGNDNNPKSARIDDLLGSPGSDTGEPLTPDTYGVLKELFNIADTPPDTAATPSPETTMEVDPPEISGIQSGSGRGPTGGARAGATQPGVGTSGQKGGITWIKPSHTASNSSISFNKSRIMYSFGYSTENIQRPSPDFIEVVTTPMALIPVDYLPFYLTHSEFEALPYGSKIQKVWCKITPLGTRTAFDTGTTLSGTATSEYVPIGMVCEGLNRQFYGRNYYLKSDVTSPMKPNSLNTLQPKEMGKRWQEHVASNAMCVPTRIDEYYCHEWNRSENPDINRLPEYQVHNYGVPRLDEKVHQFLFNQAVGQEIIHYEYTVNNGLIKPAKDHFIPWNRRGNKIESTIPRGRSIALEFFKDSVTTKPLIGDVGLADKETNFIMINQVSEEFYRKIENYGCWHPSKGNTTYAAQPQIHVGLVATPQLNPANASLDYLNSAAYWKIECGCTINFNIGSAFTKNNAISWPLEVEFLENAQQQYTDGQCLFGNTDTASGNVSTELKDYDFV